MFPAKFHSLPDCAVDIFLRDIFVDDIAQPLGAGFRREGQAGLAVSLNLIQHLKGKGVRDADGSYGKGKGIKLASTLPFAQH